MSEQLKSMKETLMAAAQSQMGNLENVNAKELGEVIDMIKDLEEAAYYCAVTKAMEESKKEQEDREKLNTAMSSVMSTENRNYYTPYLRYIEPYIDYNRRYYDGDGNSMGRRDSNNSNYYGGGQSSGMGSMTGSRGGSSYYSPYRDYREGRSAMSRRTYMESKEQHQDKTTQMRELEKYMSELSQDITEMINDASPEEKAVLTQKLNTLMTKIK